MELPKIFTDLIAQIESNNSKLDSIADKLDQLKIGKSGGDGNANIVDYETGKHYLRNTLVVYNETVYRGLRDYDSIDWETDTGNGPDHECKLKLVGFESSIVTFKDTPNQSQINALPQDTLVAIYSSTDDPYNLT